MSAPATRTLSRIELAVIAAAVLALYWLVLIGGVSPLSRYLKGAPLGIETSLSDEDLAEALRLDAAFTRMGYRLDEVARGRRVPPVFLPAVPTDLADLEETDVRKGVFLRLMLPLILVVNDEVTEDRRRLQDIARRKATAQYVEPEEDQWVADLAARYGAEGSAPQALLRRVDVVPPSLALAQAAEESGWGTSRFGREANNLFGQVGGDEGLIPQDDPSGPRMAQFLTLHEAVRAYVHNLNTHGAYEGLRRARAVARARGAFPDGHTLAGSLIAYSERGPAYVDAIRALIRANALLRYDHARLGDGTARLGLLAAI